MDKQSFNLIPAIKRKNEKKNKAWLCTHLLSQKSILLFLDRVWLLQVSPGLITMKPTVEILGWPGKMNELKLSISATAAIERPLSKALNHQLLKHRSVVATGMRVKHEIDALRLANLYLDEWRL